MFGACLVLSPDLSDPLLRTPNSVTTRCILLEVEQRRSWRCIDPGGLAIQYIRPRKTLFAPQTTSTHQRTRPGTTLSSTHHRTTPGATPSSIHHQNTPGAALVLHHHRTRPRTIPSSAPAESGIDPDNGNQWEVSGSHYPF